uniref:Uncharacterized protein n=1 Tax=Cucumis melo TaxID=3656 RepID=A0A9I9DIW4_CUCME
MAFSSVPMVARSSTFQMAFGSVPMAFSIRRRSKVADSTAFGDVRQRSSAFFSVLRRSSAFLGGRMGELRSMAIADGSVAAAILVVGCEKGN